VKTLAQNKRIKLIEKHTLGGAHPWLSAFYGKYEKLIENRTSDQYIALFNVVASGNHTTASVQWHRSNRKQVDDRRNVPKRH